MVELSVADLVAGACLVLVAGIVSIALRLGLEKSLAVASLRTVVQLLLVGYILKALFEVEGFPILAGVMILMVLAASREAVHRPSRRFRGGGWRAFLTLVLCSLVTTFAVTRLIIDVTPWYKAQYVIPLLGMILGNSLTGISLCLDQLLDQFTAKRSQVEMELALGATSWEAARDIVRESVRKGLIPIINSMMVVGIVSLPGMMTGQILAGADPLEAVKYQIIVMFMIVAATSLGCILMSLLVYQRLFGARHELRRDVIEPGE